MAGQCPQQACRAGLTGRKCCAGLAVVKYKLGEWHVVQDLFARAYDIQSTQLGPDHPELTLTMSNSAGLLRAMDKLTDAEIVHRTVCACVKRPPAW